MTLCNLGADGFSLYWFNPMRRVVARSLAPRRRFRVPEGAHLIGRYSDGITTADILAELSELLERLPEPAPLPEPQPEPDPAPPAGDASAGEAIRPEVRPAPARHPWRASRGS